MLQCPLVYVLYLYLSYRPLAKMGHGVWVVGWWLLCAVSGLSLFASLSLSSPLSLSLSLSPLSLSVLLPFVSAAAKNKLLGPVIDKSKELHLRAI